MFDSPLPASPVNNGLPLKIIAILLPSSSSYILLIIFCKNSNEPSLTLGVPAPNLPSNPKSASSFTFFSSSFQVTPKGGFDIKNLIFSPLNLSCVNVFPSLMLSGFCPFISISA